MENKEPYLRKYDVRCSINYNKQITERALSAEEAISNAKKSLQEKYGINPQFISIEYVEVDPEIVKCPKCKSVYSKNELKQFVGMDMRIYVNCPICKERILI